MTPFLLQALYYHQGYIDKDTSAGETILIKEGGELIVGSKGTGMLT